MVVCIWLPYHFLGEDALLTGLLVPSVGVPSSPCFGHRSPIFRGMDRCGPPIHSGGNPCFATLVQLRDYAPRLRSRRSHRRYWKDRTMLTSVFVALFWTFMVWYTFPAKSCPCKCGASQTSPIVIPNFRMFSLLRYATCLNVTLLPRVYIVLTSLLILATVNA